MGTTGSSSGARSSFDPNGRAGPAGADPWKGDVMAEAPDPTLLVLATEKCAYPAADAVGQAHLEYPANVHVLRVPSPVMFPEDFYLRCYARGIDGILIVKDGHIGLAGNLPQLIKTS